MSGSGPGRLLAVDLGLRMGLALLDGAGRPVWLRSKHLGTMAALPRPRTLTSDAAEALLLGLWAAKQ